MTTTTHTGNMPWHQHVESRGWNAPSWGVVLDQGGNAMTTQFVASGADNPSWKLYVHMGLDATNDRSWSDTFTSFPYIDWYCRTHDPLNPNLWFEGRGWGNWLTLHTPPAPPASVVTSVHNRCASKFIQSCESARSAFQAGQDIGELKETLESIIHPMNSMKLLTLSYLDLVKGLTRGKRSMTPSLGKALADTYLEYRFGWRPLASDVADGIAHLHEPFNLPESRAYANALERYSSTFWEDGFNTAAGRVHFPYRMVGTYSERMVGGIRNGSDGGFRPLAQELQLDLPHFLPTIWNLIPYSWIVDYFTNIGDLIDSWTFQQVNIRYATWIKRTVVEITPMRPYFTPDASVVTQFAVVESSSGAMTYKVGNRQKFSPSMLKEDFEFQIPLSSRPWKNIGALLASRLL